LFARLKALVCLSFFGLCIGRSEPVVPADRLLVVYLKTSSANDSTQPIQSFRVELKALMHSAGYRVEWRESGMSSDDAVGATVAIVELRGACEGTLGDLAPAPDRTARPSLASTAVSDGRILPFSWVNCGTLTRMLAPSLASQTLSRRDYLYGRAMARLLAHELYHVLANDQRHADQGVTKASFTVQDLLANRFEFETTALSRLGTRVLAADNAATVEEIFSGR